MLVRMALVKLSTIKRDEMDEEDSDIAEVEHSAKRLCVVPADTEQCLVSADCPPEEILAHIFQYLTETLVLLFVCKRWASVATWMQTKPWFSKPKFWLSEDCDCSSCRIALVWERTFPGSSHRRETLFLPSTFSDKMSQPLRRCLFHVGCVQSYLKETSLAVWFYTWTEKVKWHKSYWGYAINQFLHFMVKAIDIISVANVDTAKRLKELGVSFSGHYGFQELLSIAYKRPSVDLALFLITLPEISKGRSLHLAVQDFYGEVAKDGSLEFFQAIAQTFNDARRNGFLPWMFRIVVQFGHVDILRCMHKNSDTNKFVKGDVELCATALRYNQLECFKFLIDYEHLTRTKYNSLMQWCLEREPFESTFMTELHNHWHGKFGRPEQFLEWCLEKELVQVAYWSQTQPIPYPLPRTPEYLRRAKELLSRYL